MASGDVRDYGEGEALTFLILLGRGNVIDVMGLEYGEPGSTNGSFAICVVGALSRMSTDGVS